MHFLVKWTKFSVKKNKTLKKYWKNGQKFWKSRGILSVRKSGNPELNGEKNKNIKIFWPLLPFIITSAFVSLQTEGMFS